MISQTQANALARRLERIASGGPGESLSVDCIETLNLAVEVLRGNHVDIEIDGDELHWRRERVVSSMPGRRLSPETVLARTLEKLEYIDAVYISIRWKDTSIDADWSLMPVSAICTMLVGMQIAVHDIVNDHRRDDDEEG